MVQSTASDLAKSNVAAPWSTLIFGQVLQSYIAIALGNQRATIFHDTDDYTARSTDPKAEIPIRHLPQLRPVQQPNRSACLQRCLVGSLDDVADVLATAEDNAFR